MMYKASRSQGDSNRKMDAACTEHGAGPGWHWPADGFSGRRNVVGRVSSASAASGQRRCLWIMLDVAVEERMLLFASKSALMMMSQAAPRGRYRAMCCR